VYSLKNWSPSLIGVIALPRLGRSAIVKEGVDSETLSLAAGHITSTALPGEPGNVGLAAHRDTFFRELKDVRRDDEITLTTLDSQYIYRVAWFVSSILPKSAFSPRRTMKRR